MSERLDVAYKQYGELVIQAEILNNKIMEVKRVIAEELQKNVGVGANGIGEGEN